MPRVYKGTGINNIIEKYYKSKASAIPESVWIFFSFFFFFVYISDIIRASDTKFTDNISEYCKFVLKGCHFKWGKFQV